MDPPCPSKRATLISSHTTTKSKVRKWVIWMVKKGGESTAGNRKFYHENKFQIIVLFENRWSQRISLHCTFAIHQYLSLYLYHSCLLFVENLSIPFATATKSHQCLMFSLHCGHDREKMFAQTIVLASFVGAAAFVAPRANNGARSLSMVRIQDIPHLYVFWHGWKLFLIVFFGTCNFFLIPPLLHLTPPHPTPPHPPQIAIM